MPCFEHTIEFCTDFEISQELKFEEWNRYVGCDDASTASANSETSVAGLSEQGASHGHDAISFEALGDGEEEDRGYSATPHHRPLELKHAIALTKTTYRYSGTPDGEGGGLLLYAPPGMPPVNGKKYFNVLKFYSLSSQVPPASILPDLDCNAE